jgi:nucleoid-associated protein YgaU
MTFTVAVSAGTLPTPQIVPPATVVQRAQQGGSAHAALALAYTRPIISIDQSQLQYRQRQGQVVEFSFDTGTLTLNLRQEQHIADTLSPCARAKWLAHENGHAIDNQRVISRMDAEIRADPVLQPIFIGQNWYPSSTFQATNQRIFNTISTIFQRLTAAAVIARDTRAEYMRVHRDVLVNCPEPYLYEVNPGDTLGQIASFFYGQASAWQTIYRANQAVIGADPDLIRPGQRLTIPKTP